MRKYVMCTDGNTAWLLSDDLYGNLPSNVFTMLTTGVHLGGAKLVTGYVETSKSLSRSIKRIAR